MTGLAYLVFAGGFGTALMAMFTASDTNAPAPVDPVDDHADLNHIAASTYVPRRRLWEVAS